MCHGYKKKFESHSIKYPNYVLKRLNRIYPLHLLCLLWAYGLNRFTISSQQYMPWLSNILLIQSWIPNSSYYFSGNSVGWCLSDMLFFYLFFPFLIKLCIRNSHAFFKWVSTISVVWVACSPLIPKSLNHALIYISPATRLIDFSIGICLWHIFNVCQIKFSSYKFINSTMITNMCEIATVLFLIIWIIIYKWIPECFALSSYWWPPVSILIICFSISRNGIVSKFLQLKPFVSFGDISLSFYLIHVLGMHTGNILLNKLNIQDSLMLNMFLILAFDIAIAFLIARVFEKNIRKILNRLLIKY